MEKWGKKKLFGWLYNHWSSCQQPTAGSHHLTVFQEMQITHSLALWYLCKPTCSVLALDSVDPALGRVGREWNRHLLDFPHSLLCLYPGWNPSGLFKHVTQFALNSWDKGLHAAWKWSCSHTVKWCQKVATILLVWDRKKCSSKVCVAYLPRGLNGSYRETLRKKKNLFLKKMSIQNNFNKCQKIKSRSLHPICK